MLFQYVTLSILTMMSHNLMEPFDQFKHHLLREGNFQIFLSGIFLLADDVIDIFI